MQQISNSINTNPNIVAVRGTSPVKPPSATKKVVTPIRSTSTVRGVSPTKPSTSKSPLRSTVLHSRKQPSLLSKGSSNETVTKTRSVTVTKRDMRPPSQAKSATSAAAATVNTPVSKNNITYKASEFARTRLLQEFELVFKEYVKAGEIENNRDSMPYQRL